MSAFDLLASVSEMREFAGNKVENIYRTGAGFLFKFSRGFVTVTRHRVSITAVVPEKTHEGAETLRGLFRDDELVEISMPRFDRIVEFKFTESTLIAELLEPFNLLATRGSKIVWLLHSYRGKDRELKAGAEYKYPPAVFLDLLKADIEDVVKAIDVANLRKSLITRLGTGSELADEVLATAGNDPYSIAAVLKRLVEKALSGNLEPTVCLKDGKPVTVLPIRPTAIKCDEVLFFDRFWKALDFYFVPIELEQAKSRESRTLEEKKTRLKATVEELERKIPEYREEAARLKTLAHKLLMFKHELEEALRGNESSIRIVDVDGSRTKIELPDGTRTELRRDLSIGRQISDIFEKAKEIEKKAERATQVLNKLQEEIAQLERQMAQIESRVKSSARVVMEKSWFEKLHWTVTTGMRPVIGGRDASQNEIVVKKYLKDRYLFFHADIPGGSAVVMPPADDPLELLQAAQFAAAYSKAWKIGIHSVDVFYVKGEQVSKQPPSGQYLAKGSFMIYGKREYVRNVRLELAVGYRRDGDVCRVIAAPPRSAHLLAEKFVILTPGTTDRGKLAAELAKRWGLCTPEEITTALPGPSRILEERQGSPLSWEQIEKIFATW